jgi:hypothetical protein
MAFPLFSVSRGSPYYSFASPGLGSLAEFVQKIALQGGEPAPNTPGEFRQFLRSESAKFARIIADAKVTLEK